MNLAAEGKKNTYLQALMSFFQPVLRRPVESTTPSARSRNEHRHGSIGSIYRSWASVKDKSWSPNYPGPRPTAAQLASARGVIRPFMTSTGPRARSRRSDIDRRVDRAMVEDCPYNDERPNNRRHPRPCKKGARLPHSASPDVPSVYAPLPIVGVDGPILARELLCRTQCSCGGAPKPLPSHHTVTNLPPDRHVAWIPRLETRRPQGTRDNCWQRKKVVPITSI